MTCALLWTDSLDTDPEEIQAAIDSAHDAADDLEAATIASIQLERAASDALLLQALEREAGHRDEAALLAEIAAERDQTHPSRPTGWGFGWGFVQRVVGLGGAQ